MDLKIPHFCQTRLFCPPGCHPGLPFRLTAASGDCHEIAQKSGCRHFFCPEIFDITNIWRIFKNVSEPNRLGPINDKLKLFRTMVITFNELRRIKDRLPSGSMQRIADELNMDVDVVRNYFGGRHFGKSGDPVGVHMEKGPDGGVVTLDDTTILEKAMDILAEVTPNPDC